MKYNYLTNKYNYMLIIINVLFIIINNFYYLPDHKLNIPIRLASVSSINNKEGLLINSPVDDVKIIQLWLSELDYSDSKARESCSILKEKSRTSIDIIANKSIPNLINISITSNTSNYIYECYIEILKKINIFELKVFRERVKGLNNLNHHNIPAQSLINEPDMKIIKDNIYKKYINIILSLVISIQLILIIKRIIK